MGSPGEHHYSQQLAGLGASLGSGRADTSGGKYRFELRRLHYIVCMEPQHTVQS